MHRIVQHVFMFFQALNSIQMTITLLFVFLFALFAVGHGKFDQRREFQLLIKLSYLSARQNWSVALEQFI